MRMIGKHSSNRLSEKQIQPFDYNDTILVK
jgi:hypothetical protein